MKTCEKCGEKKQVACPCGGCDLVTSVSWCPRCEPGAKAGKAEGVRVCPAHVRRQLGLDDEPG